MKKVVVHLTKDLDKLLSCSAVQSAEKQETYRKRWPAGESVLVFLPPVQCPPGPHPPCQAKWYWKMDPAEGRRLHIQNAEGSYFCEHMLDVD